MSETAEPRTYGNWREPKAAGMGRFSLTATLSLLAAGGVAFVVCLIDLWPWGVAALAATGVLAALLGISDRHGLTIIDRGIMRIRFFRAHRRGQTRFTTGAHVAATDGVLTLPGLLDGTRLSEHRDAYDRPFALITHRDGTRTVVMSLTPSGSALLDQETVDQQVAHLGLWLADLGGEAGVVMSSLTVETVPDSGERLAREVGGRTAEDAPPLARRVLSEIVSDYRVGTTLVRTYATLTFDPRRLAGRRRGDAVIAREIASRLPGLTQTLTATGAGAIHLLTAREVCRLARCAFDPASEMIFEDAASRGEEVALAWRDAGPIAAEATWDHYRHDSGVSRTWVLTAPPRGVVQSGILTPILAASRDVERKRATILYRPLDSARAASTVEHDLTRAKTRVELASRPSARSIADLRAAQQAANEEASGAGLVDFTMLITATVTEEDALDDTAAAINALAASSRLLTRVAYGTQEAAFALALPLGARPRENVMGGVW